MIHCMVTFISVDYLVRNEITLQTFPLSSVWLPAFMKAVKM